MPDDMHVKPIVEMRGINKSFGPVKALVDVDLKLYPGEVLGLVGDNSAVRDGGGTERLLLLTR